MAVRSSIFLALLAIGITGASTRAAVGVRPEREQVDPAVRSEVRDPEAAVASAGGLPANVTYPESLRPVVGRMWRSSPTFRRQSARLSEARDLIIVLHLGLLPQHKRRLANAVTHIEMRTGRLARADVWLSLSNLEQHIAHELEHIIERIDGVRVELMAAQSMHGVEAHDGVFETARARDTGRTVAHEVMTAPAIARR